MAPVNNGKNSRPTPVKPPSRQGEEWKTVTIIGNNLSQTPQVQCNGCGKQFSAGPTRPKAHISGSGGIAECTDTSSARLALMV